MIFLDRIVLMNSRRVIEECNKIEKEVIDNRHYLHSIPEVGFDVERTYSFIFNELVKYGYNPRRCGKCGIVSDIGNGNKTILLRADFDALEIVEKTDISFRSKNGCMHACGHDMHSSMLLGCARVLKEFESDLKGRIRLCFQPAEEILLGAKDMISDGLLDGVDVGMMIHISSSTDLVTGSFVLPSEGVIAPSCDYFEINIIGKGSHGAMPELGNDPINVGAHIVLGLQQITSKEIAMSESAVLTVGCFESNRLINALSEKVILKGTFRAYSQSVRDYIKFRIKEISKNLAKSFKCKSKVKYLSGCPCLVNDNKFRRYVDSILIRFFKDSYVDVSSLCKNVGSEDFSYISNEIPTVMISLSAGSKKEGYIYPLHHSSVIFNDKCLVEGVKLFTLVAMSYLEDN